MDCRFHQNPEWVKATQNGSRSESVNYWSTDIVAPYSCPITQVEMNGHHGFVVLRSSGEGGSSRAAEDVRVNVISERAVRQVGVDALQAEYGPFAEEDVIKLIPGDEERTAMIARMAARREKEKLDKLERKKAKKEKRKREAAEDGATEASATGADAAAEAGAGAEDKGEGRKKAKKAASAAAAAQSGVPKAAAKKAAPSAMIASQAVRASSVISEADKAVGQATSGSAVFKSLFKGRGSQVPANATTQFIVQSGQRYNLS